MIITAGPATGLERELLESYAAEDWTRYLQVLDQLTARDRENAQR